jgi:hypothetical protein
MSIAEEFDALKDGLSTKRGVITSYRHLKPGQKRALAPNEEKAQKAEREALAARCQRVSSPYPRR